MIRQAKRHYLSSVAKTQLFGLKLAIILPPGAIVILHGPLGAGKTTLVKSIIRGLGIRSTVSSPTFVMRKRYAVPEKSGAPYAVNHIDAYRLRSLAELRGILDDDVYNSSRDIWLIEWGKRFTRVFPKERTWLVRLVVVGAHKRIATVERPAD